MPSLTRFGYYAGAIMLLLVVSVMVFAPRTATEFAIQFERRMASLEEHRLEAAGFTIPYLETGEGPTLVLLHGFTANKDNFTRIARYLNRDFHLIIPDLPGFGEASAPRDAEYDASAQIPRLIAFLDALNLEAPVHLGGSSMGGFLAARLALAAPERVASLWLLAPGGLEGDTTSAIWQTYEETGRNPLLPQTVADYEQTMEAVFHEPPSVPWFVRDTLAERTVARHDHYARILKQLRADVPLNGQVGAINTPTLLVWGMQDQVLHPSGAEAWTRAHADTRFVAMEGVGHLPMLEAPERTAEAFKQFYNDRFATEEVAAHPTASASD
ncbi:alpha/beta fold hydrolase [Algiphilus sp.]|uniref:alpha/beta fold hydrolase n=1 Tax=Algiphilus sp. TaxID=1872431 RepID=UPI0032EAD6DE